MDSLISGYCSFQPIIFDDNVIRYNEKDHAAPETLRYFLNSFHLCNCSKLKRSPNPLSNLSYSILKYGSQRMLHFEGILGRS